MFKQYPEIETFNNLIPVSFIDGEFADVIFTIGRVAFREVNNGLTLSFDYTIISGSIPELFLKDFENRIGDNIVKELQTKLETQDDIVYFGGEGGVMTDDENDDNTVEEVDDI